jgi:hypothetical protein
MLTQRFAWLLKEHAARHVPFPFGMGAAETATHGSTVVTP